MSESYVVLNAGQKVRTELVNVGGVDVEHQVVVLSKSDGTLLDTGVPVTTAAASQADGHSTTIGATTDAAVVSDANGTAVGFLRGLVKILADVWDSAAKGLRLAASATGGATPFKLISAATTNATSVKGSAGTVYAIYATNINAAIRYLKLYDLAAPPTVGTDVPVLVLGVPGNAAGAGGMFTLTVGIAFANGIALALTTGVADTDVGAVAADEIAVSLGWK